MGDGRKNYVFQFSMCSILVYKNWEKLDQNAGKNSLVFKIDTITFLVNV